MNIGTASELEALYFYLRLRLKDEHEYLKRMMKAGKTAEIEEKFFSLDASRADIDRAIVLLEYCN